MLTMLPVKFILFTLFVLHLVMKHVFISHIVSFAALVMSFISLAGDVLNVSRRYVSLLEACLAASAIFPFISFLIMCNENVELIIQK